MNPWMLLWLIAITCDWHSIHPKLCRGKQLPGTKLGFQFWPKSEPLGLNSTQLQWYASKAQWADAEVARALWIWPLIPINVDEGCSHNIQIKKITARFDPNQEPKDYPLLERTTVQSPLSRNSNGWIHFLCCNTWVQTPRHSLLSLRLPLGSGRKKPISLQCSWQAVYSLH
jgi:hypothetical protein